MAGSKVLQRLLALRSLEEEQRRLALESALGDLNRLHTALRAAHSRERSGRRSIAQSAQTGDPAERIAGLVEADAGRAHALVLSARLAETEKIAGELRRQYLAKRVERRQVETLLSEADALETTERGRREQQDIDQWFGMRLHDKGPQNDKENVPHQPLGRSRRNVR